MVPKGEVLTKDYNIMKPEDDTDEWLKCMNSERGVWCYADCLEQSEQAFVYVLFTMPNLFLLNIALTVYFNTSFYISVCYLTI